MPRKTSSPWDFGDLFQREPPGRKVYSVSELTSQVRRLLEQQFGLIWVTGEVSNLRLHTSGHAYFTLKDGSAQLQCVLFRGEARQSRQLLEDGQKVMLQGDLTVYEPRGQYQLRVVAVELQGVGALQLAFETLKRKLQSEGLFDQARKRPLPRLAQRIGLVTSPTGAAIRDVLHVIERRQPGLEIVLAPARVQGEGASREIAEGIRLLNGWALESGQALDLILVTRGGGSLEDLWAFNEEIVAQAIFQSAIPVVSAVGHEIDFTISDFVADVRAATPSAAAEIITEGAYASRQFVAQAGQRLGQLVRQAMDEARQDVQRLAQRLSRVHPRRVLREKSQYLDDLHTALPRSVRQEWRRHRVNWTHLQQRLTRLKPADQVALRRRALEDGARLLKDRVRLRLRDDQNRLVNLSQRLALLSPDHVLARGYSITMDARTGAVLRQAQEVRPGQRLKTRLQAGEIRSVAEP